MGPRASIACIDKSTEDRLRLCAQMDGMLARHRHSLRFGTSLCFSPFSREEAFLSAAPSAFLLGSQYLLEETQALCVELRHAFPHTPIFVMLSEDRYSLKVLRRLEHLCEDVFAVEESELRILHAVLRSCTKSRRRRVAKIVSCSGSKGGVGTTSIAVSVADILTREGRRVLMIDLGKAAVLPFYIGCSEWESSVLGALVREGGQIDDRLLNDCVRNSASGISVLLPPSGGIETRDAWLHCTDTLDLSMQLLDELSEQFDYLVIDLSHAEGVFPFALQCRATLNLLVTNNEASAVHLAGQGLSDLVRIPGAAASAVICSASEKDGLSRSDMLEFLERYKGFDELDTLPAFLPYDKSARYWIGSGETFLARAQLRTRKALRAAIASLLDAETEVKPTGLWERLHRTRSRPRIESRLYLPAPSQNVTPPADSAAFYQPARAIGEEKQEILRSGIWKTPYKAEGGNVEVRANERGSLALEHILFIGAVVALSAGLFIFYNNLSDYFSSIGFANAPQNVGGAAANPGTP